MCASLCTSLVQSQYTFFDPHEGTKWHLSSLSLSQVEHMEEELLADLIAVLDRASYKPLTRVEHDLALSEHYMLNVPVAVDDSKVSKGEEEKGKVGERGWSS